MTLTDENDFAEGENDSAVSGNNIEQDELLMF